MKNYPVTKEWDEVDSVFLLIYTLVILSKNLYCSHIRSAKNWVFRRPCPFVSQFLYLPDPPSPLFQLLSVFTTPLLSPCQLWLWMPYPFYLNDPKTSIKYDNCLKLPIFKNLCFPLFLSIFVWVRCLSGIFLCCHACRHQLC